MSFLFLIEEKLFFSIPGGNETNGMIIDGKHFPRLNFVQILKSRFGNARRRRRKEESLCLQAYWPSIIINFLGEEKENSLIKLKKKISCQKDEVSQSVVDEIERDSLLLPSSSA